jgi:flagellar basal-body rod modification protein FlgD
MSNVAAVSNTSTTDTTTVTKKTDAQKAAMDYNAFLQLLVAQMKNQDPLNPNDPTQQLAQLASFSNVEQSIKLNQKLDSMLTVSSLNQANAMIGRTVTTSDGAVSGVVKSVVVTDTGTVATLANGKTVTLGAGVKVE